jgi:hypothetical protein
MCVCKSALGGACAYSYRDQENEKEANGSMIPTTELIQLR